MIILSNIKKLEKANSARPACPVGPADRIGVECEAYSFEAKPILDSIFLNPIFSSQIVIFRENMAQIE